MSSAGTDTSRQGVKGGFKMEADGQDLTFRGRMEAGGRAVGRTDARDRQTRKDTE